MRDLDYGDFYRFAASVGAFLIAVAFFAPWLLLHDPSTLSQASIDQFTTVPELRAASDRRARYLASAVTLAPYISGSLLLTGAGLLLWACPKWYKRQQSRDQREDAESEEVKQRLKSRTQESKTSEADAEDVDLEAEPPPQVGSSAPGSAFPRKGATNDYLRVEDIIARKLEDAPGFELLRDRRLDTAEFDFVLLPKNALRLDADLLIEIKVSFKGFRLNWLRESLRRLQVSAALYREKARRKERSVLVVVAPNELLRERRIMGYLETLTPLAAESGTSMIFIGLDTLESISNGQMLQLVLSSSPVTVLNNAPSIAA